MDCLYIKIPNDIFTLSHLIYPQIYHTTFVKLWKVFINWNTRYRYFVSLNIPTDLYAMISVLHHYQCYNDWIYSVICNDKSKCVFMSSDMICLCVCVIEFCLEYMSLYTANIYNDQITMIYLWRCCILNWYYIFYVYKFLLWLFICKF